MNEDLFVNIVSIGISGLLSLITFLFAAWIRSQSNERLLAMEVQFLREFVRKDDLDGHLKELRESLDRMTRQLGELQRIVDRRLGGQSSTSD